MRNKVTKPSLRALAQASLVLCLALVAAAYVRLFNPEAFTGVYAPSKKPLPIYNVAMDEKKLAISFDAAWGDEKTDELLQILKERKIKTTFFLVGYWVKAYPTQVEKIFNAGHEIGNHSNTHPHMSELSEAQIIQELKGLSDRVEGITGVRPTLFRPPYGDYNTRVVQTSRAEGYEIVQWDCDSLDWKNYGRDEMVKQVLDNAKPGSIVLFHNNSEYITQALPLILDALLKQGYEIVPVSELILWSDYWIDHAGVQHPNSENGKTGADGETSISESGDGNA